MMSFIVDNLNDMHSALQKFVEYLRGSGLDEDDVFFSRLVGCELITNVIRHCGDEARFMGGVDGDNVVICVSSDGAKPFKLCTDLPDLLAESGRGLYIVNAVCDGDIVFSGEGVTAKVKIRGARVNG